MFGHTDRSHTRAAAAVWDAKRFVQIQMTNVGADNRRADKDRPARSCLRRPCKPGRHARARCRKFRESSARKRRA
jgi:hypothetical protein